jgi:hypothetical protein
MRWGGVCLWRSRSRAGRPRVESARGVARTEGASGGRSGTEACVWVAPRSGGSGCAPRCCGRRAPSPQSSLLTRSPAPSPGRSTRSQWLRTVWRLRSLVHRNIHRGRASGERGGRGGSCGDGRRGAEGEHCKGGQEKSGARRRRASRRARPRPRARDAAAADAAAARAAAAAAAAADAVCRARHGDPRDALLFPHLGDLLALEGRRGGGGVCVGGEGGGEVFRQAGLGHGAGEASSRPSPCLPAPASRPLPRARAAPAPRAPPAAAGRGPPR